MRQTGAFIREIKREDFWLIPFTVMALILGGYAATSQKPTLWWFAGTLIIGMFIFSSVIIAVKYNRLRGFIHVAIGGGLLLVATRIGIALM